MREQAQGLLDWHRLKELDEQDWLDEDEAWEQWELREKYDCHPPRPPIMHDRPFTYEEHMHFEGMRFSQRVWADEIVMSYKHNLVMGALLKNVATS